MCIFCLHSRRLFFTGSRILGWYFFQGIENVCCFLASVISDENSTVIWIVLPLYVMYHYNLACFKIWIFSSLIMRCLVVGFSEFILVQVCLASWICKFMIFIKLRKFLAVLQIFVLHQSLFISFWGSHNKNIRHFWAPGWLSRLSNWLWLRSWSHGL